MAFKMKGSAFKLGNVATKSAVEMKSPLEQTSDVPRKKIVAPMEGAESTYTEEERKNDPILKKKKKKEKRNDRGETKAEETKRIAEDKETDRLIRESNKKDFKDKQKKDDARSEKTQKEQEKRNKERSKKHRRDIKREGSLTNLLLGPFEKL